MTRFRLLIISLVLLLTACLGYLALDITLQNRNQKSLSSQMDIARERLASIPVVKNDLTGELNLAKSDNQRALALAASIPGNSTEVINALLKLGSQYHLTISPVNTESWTNLTVGSTAYKMLPISMETQGSLPDLIDFTRKIEDTTLYPYLIIQGLSIDDQLTSANKTAGGTSISAELKLALIQRIPTQDLGTAK